MGGNEVMAPLLVVTAAGGRGAIDTSAGANGAATGTCTGEKVGEPIEAAAGAGAEAGTEAGAGAVEDGGGRGEEGVNISIEANSVCDGADGTVVAQGARARNGSRCR